MIKTSILMIGAAILLVFSVLEIATNSGFTELYTDELWDAGLDWIKGYWVAFIEYSIAVILVAIAYRVGDRILFHKFLETFGRVGMAAMFIGASIFKVSNPLAFAELTAQYQMLPQFAINIFSLVLPVLELIVGILILVTNRTRENSALILAMMLMFIVALVWAVGNELGIACGCFGDSVEGAMDTSEAWVALFRDILLLPVLIYLAARPVNNYVWNVWKK
ncbi:MAG: hypothetical protein OCC49_17035 [Fibrobacterales bacterium]